MSGVREAAIWLIAALTAVAAAALYWFAVIPVDADTENWSLAAAVLVAVGFFASEVKVVNIRLGRENFGFSLMEFPMVLGLFFVRADVLVLCRLAGALLAFAWQRRAPQKAFFNSAMFALETAVAVVVWHAIMGPNNHALSPRAWLATGLAVLATGLLGSVMVSVVITIATGEPPRSVSEVLSLGQVGDLLNACFALVAVYIIRVDWRAGWLLVVVMGVLVLAYWSYDRARTRSESLAQVNRFTEVVGLERSLDALVESVLREVQQAFKVAVVQLRVTIADGEVRDWVYRASAEGSAVEPRAESERATLVDVLAADGRNVVLGPRKNAAPEIAALMARAGVKDCLMVPMRNEHGAVGSLVVADMLGDVTTFRKADVGQLQALGNHAAVTIENALRAEVIARQAAEREHLAMHDDLTGLANRRLFGVQLEQVLQTSSAGVVLMDLDRFKDVNDALGHQTGDRLLALVADRLKAVVLDDALVARFGGDEFAVLLSGPTEHSARASADLVRHALTRSVDLDGIPVAVDASVGVAVGAAGTDGTNLLRRADLAMYAAKESRSGLQVYRPELDRGDSTRLGLLADLRTAIASDELDIFYQPKVDVKTGALYGVEALSRWVHPDHGFVPPDEFIPLAEHSSLITPLTMSMLRRTLHWCQIWREHTPNFSVAVNISPRSLIDAGFVDDVARELAQAPVPASAITLEITETSLMSDPERAIDALERLRSLGIRLSVDDLGTGYSSLAYLQRLPVDEIKIDRSFLTDIDNPSAEAVVGAVIDLAHRLRRHVVAEGVEDQAAFLKLRALGCDSAQGYWLGRPMPATELTKVLSGWRPPSIAPLRVARPDEGARASWS